MNGDRVKTARLTGGTDRVYSEATARPPNRLALFSNADTARLGKKIAEREAARRLDQKEQKRLEEEKKGERHREGDSGGRPREGVKGGEAAEGISEG